MPDVDLFEKIIDCDILQLLNCIGIKNSCYRKGATILKLSAKINNIGIILSGNALIKKYDINGNLVVISKLKMNDIFGLDIISSDIKNSPVEIIAENKCEVLFLPYEKLVTPCEKLCKSHLQLIRNIMKILSKQNSVLNKKVEIISQKTIREKIIALLKTYKTNEGIFTIPYSRKEMANFLGINRCALSRELCKMRDEGMLIFNKNNFSLKC